MDDITSVLNSIASIFMFFGVICIFGKIMSDETRKYLMGEVVFCTLVILTEITLMQFKAYSGEEYSSNLLATIICFTYAIISVYKLSNMENINNVQSTKHAKDSKKVSKK
ncbi:MAG: hypothetical protein IJ809_02065 [Clostridia bacterium]|nr:hypothetical protein [Clostridia bacterium]